MPPLYHLPIIKLNMPLYGIAGRHNEGIISNVPDKYVQEEVKLLMFSHLPEKGRTLLKKAQ